MVKHIVFWQLGDENKEDNAKHIKEILENLEGKIEGLISMHVGINENGGSYDVILISEFESYDALKFYDTHPLHTECKVFIKGVAKSRESIDYEF